MSTKSNSGADSVEVILAEEQSVILKDGRKEKEVQGTLLLTNKRVIFIAAGGKEEDLVEVGIAGIHKTDRFRYADVNDLTNLPRDPSNLFISLEQIVEARGHDGFIRRPALKLRWSDNNGEMTCEFTADITGGRKKSLKDWAEVIENLRSGSYNLQIPSSQPPARDTLEWRILQVLGDMQEKGVMGIESEVEQTFKVDLDPDEVDGACDRLAKQGFLDEIPDPSGDNFYRKHSPLGEDDLSS